MNSSFADTLERWLSSPLAGKLAFVVMGLLLVVVAMRLLRPVTAIYSRSDGIVAWQAAVGRCSSNVSHVKVEAWHLGVIFNPVAWRHVVAAMT